MSCQGESPGVTLLMPQGVGSAQGSVHGSGGVVRAVGIRLAACLSGMKVLVSFSVQPSSARWLSAGAPVDSVAVLAEVSGMSSPSSPARR